MTRPTIGMDPWGIPLNNDLDSIEALAETALETATDEAAAIRNEFATADAYLQGQINSIDVTAAVNALIDGAPGALNTLNELAAAINDDASFAATVTAALASKETPEGAQAKVDALDADLQAQIDDIEAGISLLPEWLITAVGDAATDTATLQGATLAAYNAGGGIVRLDKESGPFLLNGVLTVWPGVSLVGNNAAADKMSRSTIKFVGSTAKIKIGNGGRGGVSGHFNVDCDGVGDTTHSVQYTATQQKLHDITIMDSPGNGLWVYGTQNCIIEGVDVATSVGDGVIIDGGSGGNLFQRCEWMSNTGWDLRLTDSDPGGHPTFGYQYGPAHNHFVSVLIEDYQATATTGLILVEAGTRNTFRNCGISNSSDTTFSSGYQVKITNDCFPTTIATVVEFNSCNFNGGVVNKYPPFQLTGTNTIGTNTLVVNGDTFYNQISTVYNCTGTSTIGRISGNFTYTGLTGAIYNTGGGSFSSWLDSRNLGTFYKMSDATGVFANHWPIMISKLADAGARLLITNDGTIGWGSGANFTAAVSLAFDAANNVLTPSGLARTGRQLELETVVTIPSVGYALTTVCNTGGPTYFYILGGSNSIGSWTLSNMVHNQVISLAIYRPGTQTVVWPTNVRWINNTAPTLPVAGAQLRVYLKYNSVSALWYECYARVTDVPNA